MSETAPAEITPAKPVLPSRANVLESEIPGLIGWSLPWVKAIAIVMSLIGVQGLGFAAWDIYKHGITEALLWTLLKSSSYLTLAFFFKRLLDTETLFVTTEDEKKLGPAMSWLGMCWNVLAFALVATLTRLFAYFGSGFLKGSLLAPPFVGIWVGTAVLLAPIFGLILLRLESHRPYAGEAFIKNINPFAGRSLLRLRILSVLSVCGGATVFAFGLGDFLYNVNTGWIGSIVTGVTLVLMGVAAQWYRRSVRDIHRNPTPVFFERTLNRLNFFWLLTSVFSTLLFLAGFF